MDEINIRVKALRKELGLSQTAFGARIGMSISEIKNIEYGITSLKEVTIPLICREYNVREEWLREGVGPMFAQVERKAEIAEFVGRIMKDEDAGFQARFVSVLARMTPEEWAMLERKARELLTEEDTKK